MYENTQNNIQNKKDLAGGVSILIILFGIWHYLPEGNLLKSAMAYYFTNPLSRYLLIPFLYLISIIFLAFFLFSYIYYRRTSKKQYIIFLIIFYLGTFHYLPDGSLKRALGYPWTNWLTQTVLFPIILFIAFCILGVLIYDRLYSNVKKT